jgi:hypothetical protein
VVFILLAVDSHVGLSSMSWYVCPLWEQTTLRAFCLSAPWQIPDHVPPPPGAGLIVLSMGNGILTHLSCRFPDPAIRSEGTQVSPCPVLI